MSAVDNVELMKLISSYTDNQVCIVPSEKKKYTVFLFSKDGEKISIPDLIMDLTKEVISMLTDASKLKPELVQLFSLSNVTAGLLFNPNIGMMTTVSTEFKEMDLVKALVVVQLVTYIKNNGIKIKSKYEEISQDELNKYLVTSRLTEIVYSAQTIGIDRDEAIALSITKNSITWEEFLSVEPAQELINKVKQTIEKHHANFFDNTKN